jgi:heme/copper-type cytochrome/quinol oxidase subunit 2
MKGTTEPPSPNRREHVPRFAPHLPSEEEEISHYIPVIELAVGIPVLALAVLAVLTYYYYTSKGKMREEDNNKILEDEKPLYKFDLM